MGKLHANFGLSMLCVLEFAADTDKTDGCDAYKDECIIITNQFGLLSILSSGVGGLCAYIQHIMTEHTFAFHSNL